LDEPGRLTKNSTAHLAFADGLVKGGEVVASIITFKIMVEGPPFDLIDLLEKTIDQQNNTIVYEQDWQVQGGLNRTTIKPPRKPKKD
jgi:hypothetical protein